MRNKDEKVGRLRSLPSLAPCSTDDIRALASCADLVLVRAGDVIHPGGEPNADALLVIEGTAVRGTDALLVSGDWFGAVALLDGDAEQDELRMLTDGALLVFGRREFAGAIARVPTFATALAKDLSQELRRQHEREHAGRRDGR